MKSEILKKKLGFIAFAMLALGSLPFSEAFGGGCPDMLVGCFDEASRQWSPQGSINTYGDGMSCTPHLDVFYALCPDNTKSCIMEDKSGAWSLAPTDILCENTSRNKTKSSPNKSTEGKRIK